MSEKTLKDLAYDMLHATDEIALLDFKYGTPEYLFRERLIKGAAQLRLSLKEKETDGKEKVSV
jgi:hypothetical protein